MNQSVQWICERLGLHPALHYTGGDRGWIGDNPFIFPDCTRIRALGWRPRLTIQLAVARTVEYLQSNQPKGRPTSLQVPAAILVMGGASRIRLGTRRLVASFQCEPLRHRVEYNRRHMDGKKGLKHAGTAV